MFFKKETLEVGIFMVFVPDLFFFFLILVSCIGLAKRFAQVFHKMLQKNPNKLFGQSNIYKYTSIYLACATINVIKPV